MQLPILIAQKLISCKWVKKTPTAPLIYICCCVQFIMNVYITYEKDGYGGTQVDRVFLNESDVRVYVTTETMVNNSKTQEELAKKQEGQYEVHEVVESL